jgi:hypothetical protein
MEVLGLVSRSVTFDMSEAIQYVGKQGIYRHDPTPCDSETTVVIDYRASRTSPSGSASAMQNHESLSRLIRS